MFLQVALTILGRICGVTSPPKPVNRVKYKMSDVMDDDDVQRFLQLRSDQFSNGTYCVTKNVDAVIACGTQDRNGSVSGTWEALDCQLVNIKKAIELMMQVNLRKHQENNELKEIVFEWRQVARSLDRMFFIVYLVAIILSLLFLFPRYPWHEITAHNINANVTDA